ncbi:unnamed protein product, partial [Pylaiella littoralis]
MNMGMISLAPAPETVCRLLLVTRSSTRRALTTSWAEKTSMSFCRPMGSSEAEGVRGPHSKRSLHWRGLIGRWWKKCTCQHFRRWCLLPKCPGVRSLRRLVRNPQRSAGVVAGCARRYRSGCRPRHAGIHRRPGVRRLLLHATGVRRQSCRRRFHAQVFRSC